MDPADRRSTDSKPLATGSDSKAPRRGAQLCAQNNIGRVYFPKNDLSRDSGGPESYLEKQGKLVAFSVLDYGCQSEFLSFAAEVVLSLLIESFKFTPSPSKKEIISDGDTGSCRWGFRTPASSSGEISSAHCLNLILVRDLEIHVYVLFVN